MSEYRTHLRESVSSASQALQRLADVLENGESGPAAAPPTDFRASDAGTPCPAPAGASTGPARSGEPAGATLAPDCRDMATVTPAPSSPRRWWLNVYSWDGEVACVYVRDSEDEARKAAVTPHDTRGKVETIPVVEASAYDAAVRECEMWHRVAGEAQDERDAARAELASARRITPELIARVAGVAHRSCVLTDYWPSIARAALLAAGFTEVASNG